MLIFPHPPNNTNNTTPSNPPPATTIRREHIHTVGYCIGVDTAAMSLFFRAPLPAPLARQRLKGNLAGLALLTFARTVFTPYLAFRGLVVSVLNSVMHGADAVWWIGASPPLIFSSCCRCLG